MTQLAQLENLINQLQDSDLTTELADIYTTFDNTIRRRYAEYIESQIFQGDGTLDNNSGQNMNCGPCGGSLYHNLLQMIASDINNIRSHDYNSPHVRETLFNLRVASNRFVHNFQHCADQLPTVIHNCLQREKELLDRYMPRVHQEERFSHVSSFSYVDQQLTELEKNWQNIENHCSYAKNVLAEINMNQKSLKETLAMQKPVQNGNRTQLQEQLQDLQSITQVYCEQFRDAKESILKSAIDLIGDLEALSDSVTAAVDEWKVQQKLAYVKAAVEPDISELKKSCARYGNLVYDVFFYVWHTNFYEILTKTPGPVSLPGAGRLPLPVHDGPVKDIKLRMENLLKTCFERTFVVTKQPPELIKMSETKTSGSSRIFDATVCILGAVNQNIEQFSSTVEASFCTESDICNGRTIKYKLKGDSVDFHKHAEAEFKKLILKEFSRDEGKLKDTQVWQKRYRLIFSVTITFRTELVLNLKTMSLPVILNTGSNQECFALACLTWYCYNCHVYDLSQPFPSEIPCSTAIEMLNACIKALGGRQLKDGEKQYLAEKMTGEKKKNWSDVKVSFTQFCKTNMASKETTSKDKTTDIYFFKWFHAIRNLLSKFLLEAWKDGVIEGFISGYNAKMLITDEKPGTFLLRFSESYVQGDFQGVTGGIVAVIKLSDDVRMTPPKCTSSFATSTLYENLKKFVDHSTRDTMMKWLYPTYKSFDDVFQKYNTVPDKNTNYRYPGWEHFYEFRLSKLQLTESSTEVKNKMTETATTTTSSLTASRLRMKSTSRRGKNKTQIDTPMDKKPGNIPNFEHIGCGVDSGVEHKKLKKIETGRNISNLQVPTKASLKRQVVSVDSSSGGCVSEISGVSSDVCAQSASVMLQLNTSPDNQITLQALPEAEARNVEMEAKICYDFINNPQQVVTCAAGYGQQLCLLSSVPQSDCDMLFSQSQLQVGAHTLLSQLENTQLQHQGSLEDSPLSSVLSPENQSSSSEIEDQVIEMNSPELDGITPTLHPLYTLQSNGAYMDH